MNLTKQHTRYLHACPTTQTSKTQEAESPSELGFRGLIEVAPGRAVGGQQSQHHRPFGSLLGGDDPGVPVNVRLHVAWVDAVDEHAGVHPRQNPRVGIEHRLRHAVGRQHHRPPIRFQPRFLEVLQEPPQQSFYLLLRQVVDVAQLLSDALARHPLPCKAESVCAALHRHQDQGCEEGGFYPELGSKRGDVNDSGARG